MPSSLNNITSAKKQRIDKIVWREKLANTQGFIVLLFSCLLITFLVTKAGLALGIASAVLLVGIPLVIGLVIYPQFGVIVYFSMAVIIMYLSKFGIPFPMGTIMDALLFLFVLGLFIQLKRKPEWYLFYNPISPWILIWIIYNIVEFVNPWAESRMAWVYTIRTLAFVTLMYFIFLYNIKNKKFIKLLFKWWIALMIIAALYAYKQEFIGFFGFEEAYNKQDGVMSLLFLAGHWRKYSIFSDPVTFAYNMAAVGLLCIGLMTGPLTKFKKFILFGVIAIVLSAMIFSGTRGAFPLVPAGLILFVILKFNRKILFATALAGVFTVGLIFMPTSNQNILRFQTAFRPSNDASYHVREINQARIKPFIWSHPFGGGLGSTGEWGKKFAPYSILASFPPDSGYVRTTVELGYVGLAIFCIMMFVILRTGINNYFAIKHPELKSYCLAMVLMLFAWNIANFPQEALVQYPSNVIFYLTVALINILPRLDKQSQEQINDDAFAK